MNYFFHKLLQYNNKAQNVIIPMESDISCPKNVFKLHHMENNAIQIPESLDLS